MAYITYQCKECRDVVFRGTAREVKALSGLCNDCFEEKQYKRITIPENKLGVGNRHPATPKSETRHYGGEVN